MSSLLNSLNKGEVPPSKSKSLLGTLYSAGADNIKSDPIQMGQHGVGESQYDYHVLPSDIPDLEKIRGERQGWGAELANAIGGGIAKIPFSIIGNTASMLDFEDYYNTDNEVGNAITAWAEEVKGDIEGATKIYKSNDNTLGSREWWMNNAKSLIDSAGGFVATGAGLGKGIQLLSQLAKGSQVIQGIGTVSNAVMLNQAESIPIAMGVYQKAIDAGKTEEEAADAAAYSININRINIPLNLTSTAAFLRSPALTRQVAKEFSKKEILNTMAKEGAQEYVEENVNMIAEKEANRSALQGKKYTYDFNRTIGDVFSKEGFETGIVGFLGGAIQTAGTEAVQMLQKDSPSYDENGDVVLDEAGQPILVSRTQSRREKFIAQKKSLSNIELLGKTEGVPTVKETLSKVRTTSRILNDIQLASLKNDDYTVGKLQNELLSNQTLDAFKNGTTENLIAQYQGLASDPNAKQTFGEDVNLKVKEAVKQIEDLEKVYIKYQGSPMVNQIFKNRSKHYYDIKQAEELQKNIRIAEAEQAKEIQITGYNTPELVETLQTTKELQELNSKFEGIRDNINGLNSEMIDIVSGKIKPEVKKEPVKTKSKDTVTEPEVFTEPDDDYYPEDAFDPNDMDLNDELFGNITPTHTIESIVNRLINRKADDVFTLDEQQFYDNNKSEVEKFIKDKATKAEENKQGQVVLSDSIDTPELDISEKFGEVVPTITKEGREQFEAQTVSEIKDLIKQGKDINKFITLRATKQLKHVNAGIYLKDRHIGNINGLATDSFTKDILDKVRANPTKVFNPKDLGLYFGLTDGSLNLVPMGTEQPFVKDLDINLSLTGGQHLIYDFGGLEEGTRKLGSFIGTIDTDLFQPGIDVNEKAIPRDLGRYVLVVPMDNGSVRYIRVRPAKLDSLSDNQTNKLFKEFKDKSESVKAETTVNKDELSQFNSDISNGFFIAVDKGLKYKGVRYDSYAVNMNITAGNVSGDGKGKLVVSIEGFNRGGNKTKVVDKVYIDISKMESIDDLLRVINNKMDKAINLKREDFKSSISAKNAVDNMTSSVLPSIVKSQSLVFKKANPEDLIAKDDIVSQVVEDDEVTASPVTSDIETKKADIEKRRNQELKGKQFLPVNEFDLKKGDVLYNLYTNTEEVADTFTIKAFSVGGEGMKQYLKGILFVNNKTKTEKWWNSRDRFTWNDLFIKKDNSEINAKYDAELAALEKPSKSVENEFQDLKNTVDLSKFGITVNPVTTSTDTEAKKADIERRRQEELKDIIYLSKEELDNKEAKAYYSSKDKKIRISKGGEESLAHELIHQQIDNLSQEDKIELYSKIYQLLAKVRETSKDRQILLEESTIREYGAEYPYQEEVVNYVLGFGTMFSNLKKYINDNFKKEFDKAIKKLDTSLIEKRVSEISKINAKYDAELAALGSGISPEQELSSLIKQLNDPNVDIKSTSGIRKRISELKKQVKTDTDEAYQMNDLSGKPLTQSEIDEVKSMLPKFIDIQDISKILENLRSNGIPFGVFKDKVIYLNELSATAGTAYHEAFHAVFRTVLSDSEITKYLNEARKEYLNKIGSTKDAGYYKLAQDIAKLRTYSLEYAKLSDEELENLVYEEYIADKFAEFKLDESTKNPFRRLFIIIRNLFRTFTKYSEELQALFDKISNKSFVNSEIKSNRFTNLKVSLPVFKLIPAGLQEVYDESIGKNKFVPVNHTQRKSDKLISTFAAKINKALKGEYNATLSSKTQDELFDYFVEERIEQLQNDFYDNYNILNLSNPKLAAKVAQEANKELNTYEDEEFKSILKEQVDKRLNIFKYEPSEDDLSTEATEGAEDKFGSQDSWLSGGHDSLPRVIKQYISFSTYTEYDEIIGKNVEVAVDAVTAYNGLTRILADTPRTKMLDKLHSVSKYNPNIKAVLERLMTDTGIVLNEDGTLSQPSKNYNDYQMFLNTFDNSLTKQLFTLVEIDDKTKIVTYKVIDANTNDARKLTTANWGNNIMYILKYTNNTSQDLSEKFNNAAKEFNAGIKKAMTDSELQSKVEKVEKAFNFTGIKLSKGYIEYSILSSKKELGVDLTQDQEAVLSLNEGVKPLDITLFTGSEGFKGLKGMIASDEDLFSKKEGEGAYSRLEELAEANGLFDETIGNSSFKNAEGKSVYEIIKSSYVLTQAKKLNSETYLNELLSGSDPNNDLNNRNYKFIKNNYLLNSHKTVVQNLKVNIIDGLRADGDDTGVVFGDYDGRSYLAQSLALFATKNKKNNTVKYMFRQNEASNTAYVAELPFEQFSTNNKANSKVVDILYNNFLNEFERIARETKQFDKTTKYKKYNDTLKGRAFDFTEFQYIKDISPELYTELLVLAKEDKLNDIPVDKVKSSIETYLNEGIKRYTDTLKSYGIVYQKEGKEISSAYIPNNFYGKDARYNSLEEAIAEHYLNDYVMSNSLNELFDGDYSISRKDKVDISKRNKGAMGSGNNYGTGTHRVSYIKDVEKHVEINPVNGNLVRVPDDVEILKAYKEDGKTVDYLYILKDEKEVKVANVNTIDAQSYQSLVHKIYALHALGRLDSKVWDIYKKILKSANRKNVRITDSEQSYLEEMKASLNPDKTVTFGMGIYHKTSEHTLVRGVVSYIPEGKLVAFDTLTDELIKLLDARDFNKSKLQAINQQLVKLYAPIPGFEYHHNLANQMDIHGIDQVITESASKGATLIPVNSTEEGFDLSKSMTDVLNEYKRLQVETPTGKEQITDGSQLIQLIDSEQTDDIKVNINGKETTIGAVRATYRRLMNTSRENSFKAALTYIKQYKDGSIDKTKLDAKLLRSLEASGADEVLLELFEKPYNFNMSNMVDKAEQIVLAHFSKGVLAQKVNGTKVSLVSDAGIDVLRNDDGTVVPYQEIVNDPAKYSKWTNKTKLAHNKKYPDGVYSECILSERVLTKHGLKVGDKLPNDLLKALGYRIPTQDKHSMMAFKIVGLLPNYMEGVGIFPQEIVYLSGADFDIDSEFIQTADYWMKNNTPVKYGTEETIDDKWDSFIYYKLNRDKEFKIEYKNNNKDLEATLKAFKLPINKEEFAKEKNPELLNNGVINNKILDARIALLTNEKMLEDIAYTPASTQGLKDVANDIDNLKANTSNYLIKNNNVSASDINGKFEANTKNSAGKAGIGVIANKLQVFTMLAKVNTEPTEDAFRYQIGGYTSNGYSYTNQAGNRVADSLSTILSVMTDNAKDPIAGQLNLSLELLPGFSELIAQGLPEYEAALLINLPIIQIYSNAKKVSNYALQSDIEKSITKSKTLKYALSVFLGKKYDEVTDADIIELKFSIVDISKKDMEDIISGKADPETSRLIQMVALAQFAEIEAQSDVLSNVNTLLKLNQGLDTSFVELEQRLTKAFDELGLNDPKVKVPFRIEKALSEDTLTQGNIQRALRVLNVGKKLFISQTDTFKKAYNQLNDVLNDSYANKKTTVKDVSRALLSYISTRGYINLLKRTIEDPTTPKAIKDTYTKRIDNISNKLIYKGLSEDTLAQQLAILKNSEDDSIRNNALVRYLKADLDTDLHLVNSNSFVKESKETVALLLDSYKDLYNNPKTRDFAINMFNYLIVKDNLEFKSGSFIKFVAPFMFDKLSQALDNTIKGLSSSNVEEKNVLGEDFDKLSYNFRKLFSTYVGNKMKKLNYRSLKGGQGYIKQDNNIMFNIFNDDRTLNKEAFHYLNTVFKTEQDEENSKNKLFIFPQFIILDKSLYELKGYKEYDKILNHPYKDSVHKGNSAIYSKIEWVGNKKVSPYATSYEDNLLTKDLVTTKPKVSDISEPDFTSFDDIDLDDFSAAEAGATGGDELTFDDFKPKDLDKSKNIDTFVKLEGQMTYSYGSNKRSDVKSNTTLEAIKNGERTATTRYESQGNIDYWKSAKVGDIIKWKGNNNEEVLVKVTKPLHKLVGSGKTAEQWSKLEGWSVDYFNSKVKPKLNEAWQLEYEVININKTLGSKKSDSIFGDISEEDIDNLPSCI